MKGELFASTHKLDTGRLLLGDICHVRSIGLNSLMNIRDCPYHGPNFDHKPALPGVGKV
jgi:hypothetical protein